MEKPWYSIFYIKSTIAKIVWGIVSVMVAVVAVLVVGIMEESRMAAQTGNWDGRSIEKGAELYANNCYTCHGLNGQGGTGPALNSRYFFEQRLADIGFAGTLADYVALTVAAGRPNNVSGQFVVMMPTWSARYGGPFRDDQVQQVTDYVMNWQSTAVLQTVEEDPWIPFRNTPSRAEGELAEIAGITGVEATVGITDTAAPVDAATVTLRTPQELITDLACAACHNFLEPETAENAGPSGAKIGPHLGNLVENAPNRIPGVEAADYVHESIVAPNAFIVPGYQPLMPAGLGDAMTTEELDSLVTWLLDPARVQ